MEKRTGIKQQAISRLENPYYGKATLTTLKKIADACDVALLVEFVPFSQLVNRVSGTPYVEQGYSPETMNVRSFEEEERQGAFKAQADLTFSASPQLGSSPHEMQAIIWQPGTGTEVPYDLPSPQGKATPLPFIPSQHISGANPQNEIYLGGMQ
jgi:transcriptional regulator with XRE-family HTH domain